MTEVGHFGFLGIICWVLLVFYGVVLFYSVGWQSYRCLVYLASLSAVLHIVRHTSGTLYLMTLQAILTLLHVLLKANSRVSSTVKMLPIDRRMIPATAIRFSD